MFIVWGTKGFIKDLGVMLHSQACPICAQETHWLIKKVGKKFTIFWIPLFTTSSKYYKVCPHCQNAYEITKEEATQLIQGGMTTLESDL